MGWCVFVTKCFLQKAELFSGIHVKIRKYNAFVLFDLILYVPSTIFKLNRDGSSWVEPVLS